MERVLGWRRGRRYDVRFAASWTSQSQAESRWRSIDERVIPTTTSSETLAAAIGFFFVQR